MFFPVEKISRFFGTYSGYNPDSYYKTKCTLQVSSKSNDDKSMHEIVTFVTSSFIGNQVNECEVPVDGVNCWISRNGILIREAIQKGLYGENIKIAETLSLTNDGKLVRTIYDNYWFKGLFGGYWFAEKYRFIYNKIA